MILAREHVAIDPEEACCVQKSAKKFAVFVNHNSVGKPKRSQMHIKAAANVGVFYSGVASLTAKEVIPQAAIR